ncbi:STM4011 family radical SAM protein [Paenibacillus sp. UNC451MF]|uniref:STM4011 family radical SAM protein n=1 Tax=Paenibacillus sp. UNC451MF TaxID=1449063 RepID=UPI000491FB3A|nr:STM4011 family radical SAM protein [Paenibacillus sp. UNC451MF]
MRATIYFRGSLSSCNYDCPYCPFSKNTDSPETLARDRQQIEKFVQWIRSQEAKEHRISVFFNPYGEGLTHRWYCDAMIELSHMKHVDKVAIQTNLSAKLDWTSELHAAKTAFWATYHPGQTDESRYVTQCERLYSQKIPFSVGSVGVKSAFDSIYSLRQALPEDVYMWVNAYKDKLEYYSEADILFLTQIDPHFTINAVDYDSMGKPCSAGQGVFYVQGDGRVKRCYKDRQVIGNLYRDGLEGIAEIRPCRMKQCDCYIGYIHMPELQLDRIYGERLLERIARTK